MPVSETEQNRQLLENFREAAKLSEKLSDNLADLSANLCNAIDESKVVADLRAMYQKIAFLSADTAGNPFRETIAMIAETLKTLNAVRRLWKPSVPAGEFIKMLIAEPEDDDFLPYTEAVEVPADVTDYSADGELKDQR